MQWAMDMYCCVRACVQESLYVCMCRLNLSAHIEECARVIWGLQHYRSLRYRRRRTKPSIQPHHNIVVQRIAQPNTGGILCVVDSENRSNCHCRAKLLVLLADIPTCFFLFWFFYWKYVCILFSCSHFCRESFYAIKSFCNAVFFSLPFYSTRCYCLLLIFCFSLFSAFNYNTAGVFFLHFFVLLLPLSLVLLLLLPPMKLNSEMSSERWQNQTAANKMKGKIMQNGNNNNNKCKKNVRQTDVQLFLIFFSISHKWAVG